MARDIKNIVRGTTINFSSDFYAANGARLEAGNASLRLFYRVGGVAANTTIVMDKQSNGTWFAEWQAANIDTGMVEWTVTGVGGGGSQAVTAGTINIIGNRSTP